MRGVRSGTLILLPAWLGLQATSRICGPRLRQGVFSVVMTGILSVRCFDILLAIGPLGPSPFLIAA